jgi:putative two-component system response regulator
MHSTSFGSTNFSTANSDPAAIPFVAVPTGLPADSSIGLPVAPSAFASATSWNQPISEPTELKIFIVDDEELNIRVARKYLRTWGYSQVESTNHPTEAIERILAIQPDLVLLDVMMPEISGMDLLKQLRSIEATRHLPIVILTAHFEDSVKHDALNLGANDFLSKPIDPLELLPRVKNLLALRSHQKILAKSSQLLAEEVKRQTAALVAAQHHVIHCLAKAAEYRDNETGRHVIRVGAYASIIARQMGLGEEYATTIEQAAKLHDVGKIGIPDDILLKPGKLSASEFDEMKTHCKLGLEVVDPYDSLSDVEIRHAQMGANILDAGNSPILSMASQIALTHHEKWDGTGYPFGLKEISIPLAGRITAVADVFDALSSSRPYKPAFSEDRCREILIEGRGKHFDPEVLDAFFAAFSEIVEIQMKYADSQ